MPDRLIRIDEKSKKLSECGRLMAAQHVDTALAETLPPLAHWQEAAKVESVGS
jgi:hypothetical protein